MSYLFSRPGFISERATMATDLSYVFAITFTLLFLFSGVLAAMGHGRAHHKSILISVAAMTLYYLFYYEVRRFGLENFADQLTFKGPPWVYQEIFKPILTLHIIVVGFSTFLSFVMVLNGYKATKMENGRMVLNNEKIPHSSNLRFGGYIWLIILAWWVFSHPRLNWFHQGMLLSIGYLIPAALILLIGRLLPHRERRHRFLGRLCIGSYAILLLTSALVYYLIYLAY